MAEDPEVTFAEQRREMLEEISLHASFLAETMRQQLLDSRVLAALGEVPRHEFVPAELRSVAYVDSPLPIGYGKTISQPFITALMTHLLDVQPEHRVLEVGTGLGYHCAVLASLGAAIYSIELVEELAAGARRRLQALDFRDVHLAVGDGSAGWSEHGPYDRILVCAAPELIPAALLHQLKPGGRMVVPAGIENAQQLMLVRKDAQGRISTDEILPVRFAPLETD